MTMGSGFWLCRASWEKRKLDNDGRSLAFLGFDIERSFEDIDPVSYSGKPHCWPFARMVSGFWQAWPIVCDGHLEQTSGFEHGYSSGRALGVFVGVGQGFLDYPINTCLERKRRNIWKRAKIASDLCPCQIFMPEYCQLYCLLQRQVFDFRKLSPAEIVRSSFSASWVNSRMLWLGVSIPPPGFISLAASGTIAESFSISRLMI